MSHHYLSGERALIHLDLYRLENCLSANDLFLQEEENASSIGGLLVVEWASRLNCNISNACHLEIKYMPNGGRKMKVKSLSNSD